MQQSDRLYKQNNNFTRTSRFKVVNTTKKLSVFLHLDTVLFGSNTENFASIIQSLKHCEFTFLSDVFGLLSSRKFATMATWRNHFSLWQPRTLEKIRVSHTLCSKTIHYALERCSQNNSIMPKIMLEKQQYARLILAIFDALFHACRPKNTSISLKHNIVSRQLQIYKK